MRHQDDMLNVGHEAFASWLKREYPHLGPIGDGVEIARESWKAALAQKAWSAALKNSPTSFLGMQIPKPGQPFEGGFYGGQVRLASGIFAIAWAPKSSQIVGAIGVHEANAYDYADSRANTLALAEAGSPLAQAALAANINGHTDWVLPARDVLELGYRLLKPTTTQNYRSWRDGENPSSVPFGRHYTEQFPLQTTAELFKDGGAEAFDLRWYLTSTLNSAGRAFDQDFSCGHQLDYAVSLEARARFVRLIQLNSF